MNIMITTLAVGVALAASAATMPAATMPAATMPAATMPSATMPAASTLDEVLVLPDAKLEMFHPYAESLGELEGRAILVEFFAQW